MLNCAAHGFALSQGWMTRKQIEPKEASVAATFYEPAYQRLRLWHDGQELNLLCFVKPPGESVTKLLNDVGAVATSSFRANCFSEIWELSADAFRVSRFGDHPAGLDQAISAALRCCAAAYPAAVGYLQWSDIHQEPHRRRRIQSKLLTHGSQSRSR